MTDITKLDKYELKNQIDIQLEYLMEAFERPLYNSLEVGFRHSPLTDKEKIERYEELCLTTKYDLLFLRDLIHELRLRN